MLTTETRPKATLFGVYYGRHFLFVTTPAKNTQEQSLSGSSIRMLCNKLIATTIQDRYKIFCRKCISYSAVGSHVYQAFACDSFPRSPLPQVH